ncbi:MAG: pyroglutamyl-peptidase I [Halarsenatibacteraceae bacterium]
MQDILLTGFDPFGEETINPATEVIKELAGMKIKNHRIESLEIPTVRNSSLKVIEEKIAELKPELVINIGQAGGRSAVSIERVAINVDDYRIEDNDGNQPVDQAINPDGPTAYFATLPVKAMVKKLQEAGIPAEVSNTAGTFVCNHVMYGVLDYIQQNGLDIPAGFIHIPFLPDQVIDKPGKPSMALSIIKQGILLAIEAAIENKNKDISYQAGKIH